MIAIMHPPSLMTTILVICGTIVALNAEYTVATTTSTTTSTATELTTLTSTIGNDENKYMPVGKPTNAASSAAKQPTTSTSTNSKLYEICWPVNTTTNHHDLTYPCNAAYFIMQECTCGASHAAAFQNNIVISSDVETSFSAQKPEMQQQSPEIQRLCACDSHIFREWMGCAECFTAHGAKVIDERKMIRASRSYCAAARIPTQALRDVVRDVVLEMVGDGGMEAEEDPLSGSTAVSLYFTPSIPGSDALRVPEVTDGAGRTTLSLRTSRGELGLRPMGSAYATGGRHGTLGSNVTVSSHGAPTSTAEAGDSGDNSRAVRKGAAVAVVLGLAALIAVL